MSEMLPAPSFRSIGIVGLGLIGGSFALAARAAFPTMQIVGTDRIDGLARRAVAGGVIDAVVDDLRDLRRRDLVVLAAPVVANLRLLRELGRIPGSPLVVTDVGSTKRAIVDIARTLPAGVAFVGGHPLAGSERSGLDSARPDLFAGRPWVLTPPLPHAEESRSDRPPAVAAAVVPTEADGALRRLAGLVSRIGAIPYVLDAARHDHLLAFTSHLPQLVSGALAAAVGRAAGVEGLALAGRGLADATRLARSPSVIWHDICATNADEIGPALDAMQAALDEIRRALSDGAAVDTLFRESNAWAALM